MFGERLHPDNRGQARGGDSWTSRLVDSEVLTKIVQSIDRAVIPPNVMDLAGSRFRSRG